MSGIIRAIAAAATVLGLAWVFHQVHPTPQVERILTGVKDKAEQGYEFAEDKIGKASDYVVKVQREAEARRAIAKQYDALEVRAEQYGGVDQKFTFKGIGSRGEAEGVVAKLQDRYMSRLIEHGYVNEHGDPTGFNAYHLGQVLRKMVETTGPDKGSITVGSAQRFWGAYQTNADETLQIRLASPKRPDLTYGVPTIEAQSDRAVRAHRRGEAMQEVSREETGPRRTYAEASARSSIEEAEKAFGLR